MPVFEGVGPIFVCYGAKEPYPYPDIYCLKVLEPRGHKEELVGVISFEDHEGQSFPGLASSFWHLFWKP